MSLDTVVEDIREEAHARAEEIRDDADVRAEEIVSAAEDEADEILDAAEREAEQSVRQLREQRLSSTKLEAKQERLEARRDVLETLRATVEEELIEFDPETREELTRELLDAATNEIGSAENVSVYGRAEDEALLDSILDDYDGYEYAGAYDCLGGVVVESSESRIRINNTFDSILESVWETHLREISDNLFEQ